MKILYIIKDREPLHSFRGGGQRSALIYKALEKIGDVELAVIIGNKKYYIENKKIKDPVHIIESSPSKESYLTYYWSRLKLKFNKLFNIYFKEDKVEKEIDNLIKSNQYDVIVSRYLIPATLSNTIKYKNLIVDIDDLPHEQFKLKKQNFPLSLIKPFLYKKYRKQYYKFIEQIPISFVSNPNQKENLNQRVLVNIPYNTPKIDNNIFSHRKDNHALYIGALDYSANHRSLLYFLKNVWPIVIKKRPDLIFNIVGKGLPDSVKEEIQHIKGINLLGYVENLDKLFEESSIYISPVYYGTGTNIKILEAMHYKIPIVASPLAKRGYENFIKEGENILIGSDDQDFANKILFLLDNEELQHKIATNAANDIINEGYYFDSFYKVMKKACEDISKRNH